jgi:dTDP-4-dehydrorhamnose reductase
VGKARNGPGEDDVNRLLVLGGTGMLGHKLWQECRGMLDAHASIRASRLEGPSAAALDPERVVTGVRAEDPGSVDRALDATGADAIVNCVGIVKQADAASDPVEAIRVNSLFPHQLAALCRTRGVRLIQISTDCVFKGRRGAYTENDRPDPEDLYGRSKLLGEVSAPRCLTLRTSMIGRELATSHGLVEWILAHKDGTLPGFTRAVFSGLTTHSLAHVIRDVLERHGDLDGMWHVSAEPITKHDLLVRLRDALDVPVEIVPDDSVVVDRSLDSSRFRAATGWTPPPWSEMIRELSMDPTPYDEIRRMALAHR